MYVGMIVANYLQIVYTVDQFLSARAHQKVTHMFDSGAPVTIYLKIPPTYRYIQSVNI